MNTFFATFTLATLIVGCAMDIDSTGDRYAVQGPLPSGSCPVDHVCFEALELEEGALAKPGHLAVVWYQAEAGDPDPQMEVAWSRKLENLVAEGGRLAIPLDTITMPTNDELLLCERNSDDEARSPCRGEVAVGTATVVIADDLDGNGKLESFEVERATRGRGQMVLVSSDKELTVTPPAFTAVFADGIARGTRPYAFDRSGRSVRLARGERDTPFELQVCATVGDQCKPPFPQLADVR